MVTAAEIRSNVSGALFIRAPDGTALSAFCAGLRAATANVATACEVTRAVVNIADLDPGDARWTRPGEQASAPLYHGVVELTAAPDSFAATLHAALGALRPHAAAINGYRVTRLPERIDAKPAIGKPSPGIKYRVLCRFHPDLPDSAARRSWNHHVPLALRVHQGAARYVRNWIEAPLTPGPPPFQGITELYFPTWHDLRDRWFGSDGQRAEIVQDIGHFLHSGERFYCTEHVLKDKEPDG